MPRSDTRTPGLLLLLEAWVLMPSFWLAVRVAPGPVMRNVVGRSGQQPRADLAARVAAAIEDAAGWLPRRATTCLPRACTAQVMLTRRGAVSSVRIGVARTAAGGMQAHAWIDAAGLPIGRAATGPEFVQLPVS
jgi:hypothetical protein